ncbi:hypothetical protein PR048_029314 [Dryococelus australis]|uniref:Uncharacterized protein n=1 Tax=Dryococelus australis TaxID=614101 RepID=A0ABQ9GD20_9NEOP|nr:hypothetical protein PR048_029314 [Dryococelus australis]
MHCLVQKEPLTPFLVFTTLLVPRPSSTFIFTTLLVLKIPTVLPVLTIHHLIIKHLDTSGPFRATHSLANTSRSLAESSPDLSISVPGSKQKPSTASRDQPHLTTSQPSSLHPPSIRSLSEWQRYDAWHSQLVRLGNPTPSVDACGNQHLQALPSQHTRNRSPPQCFTVQNIAISTGQTLPRDTSEGGPAKTFHALLESNQASAVHWLRTSSPQGLEACSRIRSMLTPGVSALAPTKNAFGPWRSSSCLRISARVQRRGEIGYPLKKLHRPAASSGMIPTCKNLEVIPPGIEPGSPRWKAKESPTCAKRHVTIAARCAVASGPFSLVDAAGCGNTSHGDVSCGQSCVNYVARKVARFATKLALSRSPDYKHTNLAPFFLALYLTAPPLFLDSKSRKFMLFVRKGAVLLTPGQP